MSHDPARYAARADAIRALFVRDHAPATAA